MARRRGRLPRHEPQDIGPFTDFLWPFAAAVTVLGLVAGLALAWDQIPPVREARAHVLGVEGQLTVGPCRLYEGQGRTEGFLSCSGRFTSADGSLVIPRIQVSAPEPSDADRVLRAWVTGPDAQEAYVRVDWVSACVALSILAVIEAGLLWFAVMLFLGSTAGWGSWRRSRRREPSDDILLSAAVARAAAAHAARKAQAGRTAHATDPADLVDPDAGAGPPPLQRGPRSPVAAVVLVVLGLALAAGSSWAIVLNPISPFEQIRARYFGLTGDLTRWQCHAETYVPRRGSAYPVLVCTGSFRSTDGAVLNGLGIYQPREQDVGQPTAAWVTGPDARWAFTSVEWELAVLEGIVLVLALGGGAFLVYFGGRRLVPR